MVVPRSGWWARIFRGLVAIGLLLGLSPVAAAAAASGPQVSETPVNFTVAFIGDQGVKPSSRAVLQLIKDEGADMVLHQGDLDYTNDPAAWEQMINDILGPDFPYFVSAGNHDDNIWYGPQGYQVKLQARLDRITGASCTGDLGVNSTCTYKGLFFILSGPGTILGSGHEAYIRDQLAQTDAIWRICSWHHNQRLMQVGGKGDGTGWGVYEACREGGAIVATAHEHSYSRTHLMDNFQTQSVVSTADTLQIEAGKSFVFVSGLGGQSIRVQQLDGPWWASIYTADQGANHGALFCTFNEDGIADVASCYFKDIDGNIPDQFGVISAVGTPPSPPIPDFTPPSEPTNLSATVISPFQIDLSWSAASDNVGVAGYKVFRDGTQIGTATTASYADTGLSPSTTYTYTVSAFDAAGNESLQTSPSFATTQSFTPFAELYEAEDATLVSPMTRGSDPNALGGQYISPTSGTASTSPVAEATLDFTVTDVGTYYLWVRILGPDATSDALYVGIDGSWDRVFPVDLNTYEWIRVEKSNNSGVLGFDLAPGVHTFQMGHGEISARADALFLTNDPNEVPTFK